MSLCYLMVLDFMEGTGRYDDENPPGEEKMYSDYNLRFGIDYAEWLLEEGHKEEPFHRFDLRDFIVWARRKLGKQGHHRGGDRVATDRVHSPPHLRK